MAQKPRSQDRENRLAEQLRANLAKRKAQRRARGEAETDAAPRDGTIDAAPRPGAAGPDSRPGPGRTPGMTGGDD